MATIKETGLKGYFKWLKQNQPRVYADVKKKLPANSGLGDTTISPTQPFNWQSSGDLSTAASSGAASTTTTSALQNLITAGAQAYLTATQLKAQAQLTKIQLQRAAEGKAPLDVNVSDYGLTPTAQVGITDDTKKLLIYGGSALLAVMLFTGVLKARR